ncbi:SDR family NAD(P)-dependent oxidoreductase [Sphingosinicella microcystinivorans]|uniref:3-oxoacyl-ACP reductase n=1 Tax=Sphingosinicella microcystinivorans TaxID=335406 RepID=A0AAD1G055_SPHMI|nr:SDR family NAD(P)-dependent oxidoreductase [Sphingosinicella microcystinivorans]RKS85430.1 NAD(P)-dependent dehydrogenase (short-subunit alcohol dehydrogenase family) [Sphingosinicella microcystinivorans]BBE33280.1 3-oxoacyl-ACP reductase [Sphingosinicella microcystinivorans]
MTDRIDFTGRTAIVTGAGRGLGRAYALELGRRGANVVVNDPGVASDGRGSDASPAEQVAGEIRAAGGRAVADMSDITDRAQAASIVDHAIAEYGRLDIVLNNAGIIRDRTFVKKELDDFEAVFAVHFFGSVYVTRAAWPHLMEQNYGRVLFTTSVSGTLGSFGQADYGSAKTALLGLMNTLAIEGERKNVRVNAISPAAATRITDGVLSDAAKSKLAPELVAPAALHLVSENAPTKVAIQAGAGQFSRVLFAQNEEITLDGPETVEAFAEAFDRIAATDGLFPVRAPESAT